MTLRPFLRCAVAACVLIAFAGAGADAHWTYPPTPRIPVVNSYFGTTVVDSYRWLETDAARRVDGWVAKQDALTLAYLRAQPTYPIYAKRVAQLEQRSTERFGLQIAGGHLIYLRHEPVQQQPALVSRDRIDGPERVLYDPAKHPDATGVAPAIESIFVAPDGAKVALTTQQGGAEEETLRVVDVATGKLLADTIPHAGGGTSPAAVAWDPGDTGFVHTRWPHNVPASQAHFNIALYHHALGTDPATDSYVFGHELAKTAEITLLTSVDGAQTALSVTAGDGVHASLYLRHGGGPFRKVAAPSDGIGDSADARAHFVGHGLYVVTTKRHSHGEIRAIAPGGTFASSTVVVSASNVVIEDFEPVAGGFITRDIDGGDGSARYFSNGGALRARLPIPPQATIAELAGDPAGGPIVVGTMGYAHPATWYRYVPANGTLAPTGIATKPAGRAAHLATKTKSSDDLAACARWLETHGYGTRRHLGI
ncbi:MAG: hypothetical protein ACREM6_03100, partial [Vulcanimicrobiaceae bacterium]